MFWRPGRLTWDDCKIKKGDAIPFFSFSFQAKQQGGLGGAVGPCEDGDLAGVEGERRGGPPRGSPAGCYAMLREWRLPPKGVLREAACAHARSDVIAKRNEYFAAER